MIVDLHEIERGRIAFDGALDVPPLEGSAADPVRVSEATVRGAIERRDHGHELAARFGATVEIACCRCLEPFRLALQEDFRLTLVPALEAMPEGEHEVTAEEASLYAAPTGRVDLREIVAEQIYLALPLKPICRRDCRGLCPTCGVNRNLDACECRAAEPQHPVLHAGSDPKARRRMP